jgi:outer membrane protein with glycine zipper
MAANPIGEIAMKTRNRFSFIYALAAAVFTQSASAQTPDSQPAAAPPAPAAADPEITAAVQQVKQATKMIVYPAKGQSAEQQAIDERECYVWSQQQTGIDPMAAGPNADSAAAASADKMDSATTGAAVGGAARGAAGGAIIGGITGDAGEGAAVGAVAGAVSGRRAKKKAEKQAAQQGAAQAQGISAERMATFKKGMAACLNGRAYTVQ